MANVRVARCEEVSDTVRARPDSINAAARFKCVMGLAQAASTLTDQARVAPIKSPTRQALLGMIRSGTKAQEKTASTSRASTPASFKAARAAFASASAEVIRASATRR